MKFFICTDIKLLPSFHLMFLLVYS